MLKLSAVVVAILLPFVVSDTPANCTYEDISGTWAFLIDVGGHNKTLDCSTLSTVDNIIYVTLVYPDRATDSQGRIGFWTIIYNQGFEVVVNNKKYFAFSNFTMVNSTTAVSHCSSTLNGWSHNVDGSDWACFFGTKDLSATSDQTKVYSTANDGINLDAVYVRNLDFINAINNHTHLWKAVHYPELEGMTLHDRLLRAGGVHQNPSFPDVAPSCPEMKSLVKSLSKGMDWRMHNGNNYVTPIRNQGQCGSCYAFASLAMLESRLMIMSHSFIKKVFSPQDVVGCSEYSQGCAGGFPYLIAGKYAEDFGVVEESCFPYIGSDSKCDESPTCKRYRATDYKYVGGYFGACNEEQILIEVQNGPVSVAFEVTTDFQHYKSGIYQHTGLTDKFNPFRLTNHAVLVVGYDEENGVKYWIVKNSWGAEWGESGYFRIIRGTNELNIESMAVVAKPILP